MVATLYKADRRLARKEVQAAQQFSHFRVFSDPALNIRLKHANSIVNNRCDFLGLSGVLLGEGYSAGLGMLIWWGFPAL